MRVRTDAGLFVKVVSLSSTHTYPITTLGVCGNIVSFVPQADRRYQAQQVTSEGICYAAVLDVATGQPTPDFARHVAKEFCNIR